MRIANYDSTFNLINCIIEPGDKFYVTVDGKRQGTQVVITSSNQLQIQQL